MESSQTEDVCSKLEGLLKARNKILCHKEIMLPCAHTDDIDLTDILDDENTPKVKPHKHLQDNKNLVNTMMENIRKLKHTSEREMNFVTDQEKNLEDEINQTILRFRQQTEKVFKKMINTQVEFNECLSNNITGDNLENQNCLEKHFKLIEQTCKLNRGLEAVIGFDIDKCEVDFKEDMKIENEDDFLKVSNQISQTLLNKTYEAGKKTFKNHEHFQAIKQYNKHSTGITVQNIETGTLDPFTRKKITQPVRNKVCKHIYDQESVDLMFQSKHFVPCPYIGCANKHFTKKDLLYEFSNDGE